MPVNAGIPQCSVLSPTLSLLHINDMLENSSIHCYADDSTVDAVYSSRASLSRENAEQCRNKLMSSIEASPDNVSSWSEKNFVQFYPLKTHICLLTTKKIPFIVSPVFQNTSLTAAPSINILGLNVSSDCQYRDWPRRNWGLLTERDGTSRQNTVWPYIELRFGLICSTI